MVIESSHVIEVTWPTMRQGDGNQARRQHTGVLIQGVSPVKWILCSSLNAFKWVFTEFSVVADCWTLMTDYWSSHNRLLNREKIPAEDQQLFFSLTFSVSSVKYSVSYIWYKRNIYFIVTDVNLLGFSCKISDSRLNYSYYL